jgi:hypothetical protein
MLARWSALLVVAFVACGRNPMGLPGPDAAPLDDSRDSADTAREAGADSTPEMAIASEPDGKSDLPPIPTDGAAFAADACVPLSCQDPTCFLPYCGQIGDGCGSVLDCGGCAAGQSCRDGQCSMDECVLLSCYNPSPFPYCGSIGNGCGGTLDCACHDSAWACVDHICMPLEGCVPIAGCAYAWGGEYCGGPIGDGCGGVLDCSRPCSRDGFSCRDNVCVDASGRSQPYDAGALDPMPQPPPLPPPPPPPACPPPPPLPAADP